MHCKFCQRSAASLRSLQQHEIRCKENPQRISLDYLSKDRSRANHSTEVTACGFCSKVYSSKIALGNHRRRCPSNPDREIQRMSEEGRQRSRAANELKNQRQWADPEFRQRHRISMQRAVRENPDSYTSSNRGRVREIIYEDQVFQGSWELSFYQWARSHGLAPLRGEQAFPYEWSGSRLYFPDFWIPELEIWVEVKGYETERDRAKWQQFPGPLCVIKAKEIKAMQQDRFPGLDSQGVLWYNKHMGL